jgi:hypothetical protein
MANRRSGRSRSRVTCSPRARRSRPLASERVGSVTLSLFSGAELMNVTAYNQSTHIVSAHKWALKEDDAPYLINEQNQVLFFNTTVGDPAPFADIFRGLLDILWLPVP